MSGLDHAYRANPETYASARLVTLGDGAERGVRVIEMRAGGGFEAEIVVDRSFDIGRLALAGETVSWHSPGGYRAPWFIDAHAARGQGFLGAMSGFLATCGFDHIRQPEADTADHAPLYPGGTIDYPLHGTGAHQPARLIGYGTEVGEAGPYLWAEGEITRATFHLGALRLRRRIEMPLGAGTLAIADRVENIGPTPMPVMMLYHFNVGHPLVGEEAVFAFDPAEDLWASGPHDPRAPFGPPQAAQISELSIHRPAPENGWATCRIENPANGLELAVSFDAATLPYLQLLRLPGRGTYMAGIEPCSTGARSRTEARERGELTLLPPGASRAFSLRVALTRAPVLPSER